MDGTGISIGGHGMLIGEKITAQFDKCVIDGAKQKRAAGLSDSFAYHLGGKE